MINIETFAALRNYAKGKIDAHQLMDADKLFDSIKEDYRNPAESIIRIDFNSEEDLLRTLGLSDDDIYFYLSVTNPYDNYDFIDGYNAQEEFKDGYGVYDYLDEENINTLSQISRAILPKKVDFADTEYLQELSSVLLQNFKRETEDIIDDYVAEKNIQMNREAYKVVEKELQDYIDSLGFEVTNSGLRISVGELINLYLMNNAIHVPLKKLLENLFESDKQHFGWNDDIYEYANDEDFDSVSFNRYAGRILDNILQRIEDAGEELGLDINDFTSMTARIEKKFKTGGWYILPKDTTKQTRFKVEGFEFPNMKISVSLQKGLKQKTVKLSEQNFYNLLYQPSLFSLDEI
jgi:hypothetical protein